MPRDPSKAFPCLNLALIFKIVIACLIIKKVKEIGTYLLVELLYKYDHFGHLCIDPVE